MIIPVKTSTDEYNIYLGQPIDKCRDVLNLDRRVLIVTDSGVPKQYAETVAKLSKCPFVETVECGEKSKNFENYKRLLSVMTNNEFTRKDCVVAVGGGVVGDLSGFVAASYMRGVDFYNIPTTVLSQVDSSIGGKVAIDFLGFKNIVGAFYPPRSVVIDFDVLKTLPKRQISNGLAESLKMSLTSDKELFRIFKNENPFDCLPTIIEKSLKIKKAVVEQDEKESGLRKILNFGHTVGHAIETENEMEGIFHGEAVAVGMTYMCSDSVKEQLIPILKKLELPICCNLSPEVLIRDIKHDKKSSGDKITAVFVDTVGEYRLSDITFSEMLGILKGGNAQ